MARLFPSREMGHTFVFIAQNVGQERSDELRLTFDSPFMRILQQSTGYRSLSGYQDAGASMASFTEDITTWVNFFFVFLNVLLELLVNSINMT